MKDTTNMEIDVNAGQSTVSMSRTDYKSADPNVSHPQHYKSGGMEAIDVIEAFTADLKGVEAVDTGNALKYIMRWHKKNGVQDIEKAIWYLTHLKNHLMEK